MKLPTTEKLIWFAFVLGLFSISLSAYVWARSSHLYLPLPISLPTINILLCVLSAIILPLSTTAPFRFRGNPNAVFDVTSHFLTLAPVVILTLSLVYCMPTSLFSCSIESRWDSLFRAKNVEAIRSIQGDLRCCGLNSMHDRAWPFPSKGIDATECERTQGWDRRCLDIWTKIEYRTAGTLAFATVASWIFIVLLVYIVQMRQLIADHMESGTQNDISSTRLLNGPNHSLEDSPQENGTTTERFRDEIEAPSNPNDHDR